MDVVELTRELVEIYSPSGNERRIGRTIYRILRETGMKVRRQRVERKRYNVIATSGEPRVLLSSHMDTVPGFLEVWEDEEFLYGRGTADAKGSVASMMCAAERLIESGMEDFGLLFTVGEEQDFCGVKKAVGALNPEFVVIGEPTRLKLALGQKGLIGLTVRTYGIACSGAMPWLGKSAICTLIDVLKRIMDMKFPKTKELGETVVNVGIVRGGSAINVVPDYAEALIEIRSPTSNRKIVSLISRVASNDDVELEVNYSYEPVITRIERSVLKKIGLETCVVPYFSEAYFWKEKAEVLIVGPGDWEVIHTNNEKVSKKELNSAVDVYTRLVRTLSSRE
jgi:acetylornithine deacetylase